MLQPKKMKYAKWHRAKIKPTSARGTKLSFGSFGLKAMSSKWITARQIEACRLAMVRSLKKKGKFWIRIFPSNPVTKKGEGVTMGGGKGKVDHYIFPVAAGRIIFELDGVEEEKAREVLKKAGDKLPVKTKFILRK
jgi:large subunit ribosomal protein L16